MNKQDERKRGVPARGQRRKRQRNRQDDIRKQEQPKHHNPQKQQHQKQKQRRATTTASNVNVNATNDIEEQLRLQRKKKQQSAAENTNTNSADVDADADSTNNYERAETKKEPPPPRKQMGRFRYDPERGAYFPANHNHNDDIAIDKQKKKQQQEKAQLLASHAFAASRGTARTSTASFAYPASLCSSSAKRSRLVAQWGGKCLLESATFTPSAVQSRTITKTTLKPPDQQQWHCFFPNSHTLSNPVSDLSCKSVMPPWTRTFDVARSTSTSSDAIPPLVPLLVTTLTDEGAMTRCTTSNNNDTSNSNNNNSNNSCSISRIREPCVTTRFLQGHRGGVDVGFVLQKQDYSGGSDFVRKQVDAGRSEVGAGRGESAGSSSNRRRRYHGQDAEAEYLTHIPTKVNDFVGMDDEDGAVLFAAMMHGADRKVTPWSIDYRSSTVARAVSVDNFPQSEAVCVAIADGGKGSLAYFGHRTGEVTLWDARNSTCQSTLPRQSGGTTRSHRNNEEVRTIVNVFPLTETPHYVLTRDVFDTCCLYDMRKLTSSSSSSCGRNKKKEKDPSIVHNFTVPSYVSRRTETKKPSLCSGIATNPSQTFVIAPYTRAAETRTGSTSATEESCLGMWSLYTGEFIGSKDILAPSSAARTATSKNSDSDRRHASSWAQEKRGPCVVELCTTITPAWAWKQRKRNTPRIEKVPGSFGLWFKSNCDLAGDDNIPGEAGSIHHVFFDGRPD
jgi:hypothetical protein